MPPTLFSSGIIDRRGAEQIRDLDYTGDMLQQRDMLQFLVEDLDAWSAGLMSFEVVFFLWLMIDRKNLSPFVARKLCHTVSGIIMMALNCDALLSRLFVYAVAIMSLLMTWEVPLLPAIWFGAPRDIGITIYLTLVMLWVYLRLPLTVLSPVFLADPAGAVVGKWASRTLGFNPRWIGEKTICGSTAVFIVTFLSLTPLVPLTLSGRVLVALLATIGEAIGGAYDNIVIAAVVIVSSGVSR